MNNKEPCCFLDEMSGNCRATTHKECPGKCAFRETESELKEGRKKANERIATLPDEQQKAICEKYHKKTNI